MEKKWYMNYANITKPGIKKNPNDFYTSCYLLGMNNPMREVLLLQIKEKCSKQQVQDLKVSGRSGTNTSIRNRHRLIKCQMVKIEKKN